MALSRSEPPRRVLLFARDALLSSMNIYSRGEMFFSAEMRQVCEKRDLILSSHISRR